MSLPDPELEPSRVLGYVQQAIVDAADKALQKICDKYGYDRAYWDIEITTRFRELSADFKPLHEQTAIKHFEINEKD